MVKVRIRVEVLIISAFALAALYGYLWFSHREFSVTRAREELTTLGDEVVRSRYGTGEACEFLRQATSGEVRIESGTVIVTRDFGDGLFYSARIVCLQIRFKDGIASSYRVWESAGAL